MQSVAVPYARMDSILDLSRALSSTMGRAVKAESIVAIASTWISFGHGRVAMRRLLCQREAPWVLACVWSSAVHRHCRGALARVQPRAPPQGFHSYMLPLSNTRVVSHVGRRRLEIRCCALIIYLIYLRCSPD